MKRNVMYESTVGYFHLISINIITDYRLHIRKNSTNIIPNQYFQEKIVQYCLKRTNENVIINARKGYNSADSNFLFSYTPKYLFEINNINAIFRKYKRFRKVYVLNEMHIGKKNYPAESITIIVSTHTTFGSLLKYIRDSIWWNHEAKFLIVDNNLKENC